MAQSVPGTMVVGQSYAVSVRMRNDGEMTWTAGQSFRLGSQNPRDNMTWGLGRVEVAGSVATGQEATFHFAVRAPNVAGTYNFQWQMVQDGQAWFGGKTTNLSVKVQASEVKGTIDGLSGTNTINGWACSTGIAMPIDVHLYLGGAAGAGGTFMGGYRADQASEAAVAAACQVSGGAYRFAMPITAAMRSQYGGKTIYVHGISPVSGNPNNLLAQSGGFVIPPLIREAKFVGQTVPATMRAGSTQAVSLQFQNTGNIVWSRADNYRLGQDNPPNNGAWGTERLPLPYDVAPGEVVTISASVTAPQAAGTYAFRWRMLQEGVTWFGEPSANVAVSVEPPPPPPPPPAPAPSVTVKRQYVYDAYHQLCKIIEPESGATVMAYDAAGNLAWSASGLNLPSTTSCDQGAAVASGRRVDRTYDARNRIVSLSFPDGRGNQVWSYTPDGLPAQVTTYNEANNGAPVVNTYSYNRRRLLTGESVTQIGWYTWTLGYGYDANGSLASQTYPSGLTVAFAPNALGQPTQAGNYATGVTYHPNGAIKSFTYGNGLAHTMTQSARQLPARVIDSGNVLDHEYGYDPNGNVTSTIDRIDGNRSRWMTYDGLDRLTSAGSVVFGGDHWHRFSYDALDNLRSWSLAGVKDHRYYYDANHRLTNVQNSAGATIIGLSYDVQGNLLNKSGQTYGFDYGNRLREVTGKEGLYRYDAHGRRVLAWSPIGNIVSQYGQSGQLLFDQNFRGPTALGTDHVYLGGRLVAQRKVDYSSGAIAVAYQHTDALGSPVAVSNAAGQVIDRTNFEPYGAAIGKPNYQGVGYTGHVTDAATGLTYMQQRYYEPEVGRFLSLDPVGVSPINGLNFNRYWYASNNPYKNTDPDGRCDGPSTCAIDRDIEAMNSGVMSQKEFMDRSEARAEGAIIGLGLVGLGRAVIPASAGVLGRESVRRGEKEISAEASRGIRSLEKRIAEHKEKMDEFKKNPTVRPGMEKMSKEAISDQQKRRIEHLEKEIKTFRENIDKLRN